MIGPRAHGREAVEPGCGSQHPHLGFLGGSAVKNPPASAGDGGLIPGPGRCPGGGLEFLSGNPVDGGAWLLVHAVRMRWIQLSN